MNQNLSDTPSAGAGNPARDLHLRAMQAFVGGHTSECISLLQQAARLSPASGRILCDLGTAYWRSGNFAKAEEYFSNALLREPGNPYAMAKFSVFLMHFGRGEEAQGLLQQARMIAANQPEVLNALGLQRYKSWDLFGAQEFFLKALKQAPGLTEAHINLGDVLRASERLDLAREAYLHALKLDQGSIEAEMGLAEVYFFERRENRVDEVLRLLRGAVAREPANPLPRLRLIVTLEALSRVDEALAEATESNKRFPRGPALIVVEARLLRRQGKIAEAISLLGQYEAKLGKDAQQTAAFYFELGHLYERSGDADKAFQAFKAAKTAQAQTPKAQLIDKKSSSRFIQRTRQTFTTDFAGQLTPVPMPAGRASPVFLVGFPRSGTTLLDQILSSCPGVQVANEIPAVNKVVVEVTRRFTASKSSEDRGMASYMDDDCYPACLAKLTPEEIGAMRRMFFSVHKMSEDVEGTLFIDKLPLNLLHAGIIKRMFPDAKFILALRHPCDTVLSFFMQELALNRLMVHSLDIEDSARLYDQSFSLWEHYASVLDLDVHAIRYEDVVANFRPTIEALLTYLGIEWTDAVLEFDKTAKARGRIGTPSYHQVTQKLYTRASGRWQRYRTHLEPVLPILAPHAARYGYAMDVEEPVQKAD